MEESGKGDPKTMAAGKVLETLSESLERRRLERQTIADAENKRRQNLMEVMANYGAGVGQLGMA